MIYFDIWVIFNDRYCYMVCIVKFWMNFKYILEWLLVYIVLYFCYFKNIKIFIVLYNIVIFFLFFFVFKIDVINGM